MKAKVTKKEVLAFLQKHKHCSIATVTPDGKPEAATIYYGIDKHFNFYFPTGTLSRKFKNLRKNPHVALVVSDTDKLITVQMEGVAQVIQMAKKDGVVLRTLIKSMTPSLRETLKDPWDPVPPVIKMKNGSLALLQVKLQWVRWADYSLSIKETKGVFFVRLKI